VSDVLDILEQRVADLERELGRQPYSKQRRLAAIEARLDALEQQGQVEVQARGQTMLQLQDEVRSLHEYIVKVEQRVKDLEPPRGQDRHIHMTEEMLLERLNARPKSPSDPQVKRIAELYAWASRGWEEKEVGEEITRKMRQLWPWLEEGPGDGVARRNRDSAWRKLDTDGKVPV